MDRHPQQIKRERQDKKKRLINISKNSDMRTVVKNVLNNKKRIICLGITAYPAKDAKIIAGAKSNEIENLLGYHSRDVIIHRDDMVLKN